MKYSQLIGVVAALVLIGACWMPWAYYPDLDKSFTGFFSELNRYGKPGKVLVFFSAVSILLFLVPKVWAKRSNMLVAGIAIAWAIKSFISYSGCYGGICPEKLAGIWIMLGASVVVLVMTFLPDLPVKEDQAEG